MKSGVYIITNLVNNKLYIGSTNDIFSRLGFHKSSLKGNYHPNKHLQSAYNKYGLSNFTFDILEECEDIFCISLEQYWMNMLDVCNREFGYNSNPVAGKQTGYRFTEAQKLKCSIAKKGIKFSKEWCNNISKSKMDIKATQAHKDNISKARKGIKTNIPTPDHVKEIYSILYSKPIIQYDLNNNKIKVWDSTRQASEFLKIRRNDISANLNNKIKICNKKFKFKFFKDVFPNIEYKR